MVSDEVIFNEVSFSLNDWQISGLSNKEASAVQSYLLVKKKHWTSLQSYLDRILFDRKPSPTTFLSLNKGESKYLNVYLDFEAALNL